MLISINCDWCGKEFSVKPYRLKGVPLCCSVECSSSARKAKTEKNVKCYSCGKDFHVKPFHLKRMKNPDLVCCSRECGKEARRIMMSGERNHQHGLLGELNSSHKSDIRLSNYGYIKVINVNHPMANYDGYIFFHRLVMEEYLKAIHDYRFLVEIEGEYYLDKNLIVHHKDENKINNLIDNLEVMTLEEHAYLHTTERNQVGKIKEGRLYRNHQIDAGQDVFSGEDVVIPSRGDKVISTNLFVSVPIGYVGLLWSRSGLSVKHKIEVGAGCIDAGYHGEVKVHLYNHGDIDYAVKTGDSIAQLLTIPVNLSDYHRVDDLGDSQRNDKGFGSTLYA